MDFQLLGPFEARYDGAPVDLGRRRERCLLGVLLLDVGRVVPLTRLAALLWDDDPPDNARGMLQTHVSRLRSRLDPDRDGRYGVRLVSRGGGYLVETDADRVDVHRFRTLLESAGRIASPAERAAGLRQALDLWHGPLLADVAPDRLRERIGTGLVELRLSAWESWAEAGLAAGAHRAVLPELTDLVEEYPARERLTAALMRALFHDGRQPDALSVYRRVRDRLADEYGLDPGPALARLHDEMLRSPAPGTAPDAAFTAPVPAQLPGEAAYF